MTGLLPVAALRFREALAGRMAWIIPLHFILSLAAARAMPGPTTAARLQAADATALALAAILALVAAAVLGAGPLPTERERARGALLLAAPVTATARVLGTAFGTGMALFLLLLGLCASAMAAVDLGVGGGSPPHGWVRAESATGGVPDPREEGLFWLTKEAPTARIAFGHAISRTGGGGIPIERDRDAVIEARARVPREGEVPGIKKVAVLSPDEGQTRTVLSVPVAGAFRTRIEAYQELLTLERVPGNFDLGLRLDRIRLEAGPRPRAEARLVHAGALMAGLLAVMLAATALSTITGTGVAAAGAIVLALLSLFRSVFLDAASTLVFAGSMAKALEDSGHAGHLHDEVLTGTPTSLAPLFRGLASVLPDGTRFDLGAAVAANEVPDPGDAGRAVLLGFALAALFLLLAVPGARRRP